MIKLKNNQKGFSALEGLLIVIILVIIGTVGWIIYKNNHKTVSVAPKTSLYAILAPATVASKSPECYDNTPNGSGPGPSTQDNYPETCRNGDLNVDAWNQVKSQDGGSPVMMKLGYDASAKQICQAYLDNFVTGAIQGELYDLSAKYYGWHFATDPTLPALQKVPSC